MTRINPFLTCLRHAGFGVIVAIMLAGSVFGAEITAIDMSNNPYAVRIKLSGKTPYKVVQFDKKEILVAFKNAQVSESLTPKGNGEPFIRQVRISPQKREIVSMIITTAEDVDSLSAVWLPVENTLMISFAPGDTRIKQKQVKKRTRKKHTEGTPATSSGVEETPSREVPVVETRTQPVEDTPLMTPVLRGKQSGAVQEEIGFSLGDRTFDNRYSGSTEDLFLELRSDACEDLGDVKRGVILCNQGAWGRAFEIFSRYSDDETLNVTCLENILILQAYSFFNSLRDAGPKDYFQAVSYFQKLIAYFPDSVYVPYALTCLGKIYIQLLDITQAEGYFQVVLKNYKSYPGTPEVMFELGRIYTDKNDNKLAVAMLKNVVEKFPRGSFIGNAKLQLGKALFNTNDYQASVAVLEDLLKTKPRMIYDTSDLLQYLGNAYYHSGDSGKARQALSQVFNLFPDIEGKDTILTRIGDTYVENKQKDKAIKVFQLVVDTYPGSDGFVISTMRLAEFLDNPEEKEKMYNMVIDEFPDNPLSGLALMRLALLQHDGGKYEKSVDTVKKLLEMHPRALKRDAVNLMQDSSELIFKKLMEKDEYTELISRFEKDKRVLDESENPNLFLLVGMAYLKAHLHENAVDMLMKSYKRTGEKKRPADLIHALGVALDEAGRADDAMDMFKTYIRYFDDKEDSEDSHARMGTILYDKKQYKESVDHYKKALSKSKDNTNKAKILVSMSKDYKALNDYNTAVTTLIKAINILAEEPKESFDTLSLVHRNLGENYMQLKAWEKAADAFAMAVKFAPEDEGSTEIYFMMGDAYRNSRKFEEAEKAYQAVMDKGDSFWGSMAKERLRSMKLREKLENT